ncbi:MAG TPA: hypothetical protein VFR81_25425 [Longimicrobium sp.]|nr:hypothetical protein [Longimicrobium sp.]
MRIRLPCLLAVLTAACVAGDDGARVPGRGHDPAVIPRFAGALDTFETRNMRGLPYNPQDHAMAWTPAGDLIVAHEEQYSAYDVKAGTCSGSGFYAVPASGGPARPLATGAPACDALGWEGVSVGPGSGWVVYSTWIRSNNSVLVRLDLASGRTDTLRTACRVYLEEPAVSPDGSRIAAVGICAGRGQDGYGLYLLNADGSGLRELMRTPGRPSAAWSPDGERLLVVRAGSGRSPPRIAVIDTAGRVERELGPGAGPSWSPDGAWIAYLHYPPEARDFNEIHVMRADGRDKRLLFRNRVTSRYEGGWGLLREGVPRPPFVWSPDSRHLAFSRIFRRGTSVWRVELSSGTPDQVTAPGR